jgi:hypothetical protein
VAIDESDGITMAVIEGIALEALAIGNRDVQYWTPLIAQARRIRGPLTGGNSAQAPSDPLSILDRVDAMHALVTSCGLPRLDALVGGAVGVLGHVLRDGTCLLDWLLRTPPGEPMVRSALVTALGLLGVPAPMAVAWPDPSDPDQAEAYFGSLALLPVAECDGRRVMEGELYARGAAVALTEVAVVRMESGSRLAMVG